VPSALVPTYHLQGGADPSAWQKIGVKVRGVPELSGARAFAASHDVAFQDVHAVFAGNVPLAANTSPGWNHRAANSVLGARTNTEGRESTSAACSRERFPIGAAPD
jgi:hypothetical protein